MAEKMTDDGADAAATNQDEECFERNLAEVGALLAGLRKVLAHQSGLYPDIRVAEMPEDMLVELRRLIGDMRQRLRETETRIERSIRAHPLHWLGGALAIVGVASLLGRVGRHRS